MKTKRFYIIGAVLLAAMGTFAYQNHGDTKKSDLAIENIEALSGGEGGSGATVVNCLPMPGATCIVMNGNGDVVYIGRDQYAG